MSISDQIKEAKVFWLIAAQLDILITISKHCSILQKHGRLLVGLVTGAYSLLLLLAPFAFSHDLGLAFVQLLHSLQQNCLL